MQPIKGSPYTPKMNPNNMWRYQEDLITQKINLIAWWQNSMCTALIKYMCQVYYETPGGSWRKYMKRATLWEYISEHVLAGTATCYILPCVMKKFYIIIIVKLTIQKN